MENIKQINLSIAGMTCGNCALGIKKKLENLGLEEVSVDFATGVATYKENPDITLQEVIEVINDIGAYSVINQ